ncbi:UbiA family prenyltransferase [Streptomyces sp. KR80]|uniref:UbiA family prenyltransferase n=1 Tax=Streptomyces sp. KR80 TaxID=3457426 RepID=UPI003FD333F3
MAPENPSRTLEIAPPYHWTGGMLRACHPVPTAAVTLLVTALAVGSGRSGAGCALVAGAVLAGQLSIGWCNDATDAVRDTAVGRSAKPVAAGAVSVAAVRAAAVIALALCVPLSLASGALAGTAHLVGVGAGWAYNLRLKATPWSWFPYAVGFGSLPAFISLGLPGQPWPPWWLVAAAALLGVGAHLADVLPDIDDDLRTGVRGCPQRLGPSGVRLLLAVPLVAASALLVLAGPARIGQGDPSAVSVVRVIAVSVIAVLAAGGAWAGRVHPRAPFLTAITVAMVDVGLLLWRGSGLA